MTELSDAFIDAAFRGEPEAVAQLVILQADALAEPIRVTDWPGGIVANGEVYQHFPFALKWAAPSQDNRAGEGQLTIANVDRRIEDACDASLTPPTIGLSVVRVDDPDVYERAITGARIQGVSGDRSKVSATIIPRNFAREPAVAFSYTPGAFQGLF